MKVILRDDVPNLGKSGEIVEVKGGFGRNHLIPRNLAVEATRKNLAQLDHEKRLIEDLQKKRRSKAEKLAAELGQLSLTITCQVGEQDKLFGSVTARDISDQLRKEGYDLSRKQIIMEESLKQLGVYNIPVKIGEGIDTELKVWLVRG